MAKLIAWMNGERVGTLMQHHDGTLSFQYAASWLQHPLTRPLSLSLPLQRAAHHSVRVSYFFENLLSPIPLTEKEKNQAFQTKSCGVFAVLQKVGHRLPGALIMLPVNQQPVELDDESIMSDMASAHADSDNAFLCLALARELGLPVPDARLLRQEGGGRQLCIPRDDRRWNADRTQCYRLPTENLCQALGFPPACSHEQSGGPGLEALMGLLMGSRSALTDREAIMRCLVFQWLTGITSLDAQHIRLFIEREGSFRLAPFRCLVSAWPARSQRKMDRDDIQLPLGVTGPAGKLHRITQIAPSHFLASARTVRFSGEQMHAILNGFVSALPAAMIRVRDSLPEEVSLVVADAIFSHSLLMLEQVRSLT